jgi:hypothetical protein
MKKNNLSQRNALKPRELQFIKRSFRFFFSESSVPMIDIDKAVDLLELRKPTLFPSDQIEDSI